MRALSLFSGAGGLDLGLHAAGMTTVGYCEIDPTARQVLARHWPDVPCHDDVTTLDGKAWRGRVDLVAGGSPCQDLSVAGRRGGLDGERSGLFWEQCRIATESAARWVLWENVAGALSSNDGADFASVLWGLSGCRPEVPEGGWRPAGVCVGPERTAVWRMFDARYFGVPQRRRRVFVVAGPRGECGPEVLLEPESCGGDTRPRRETGQDIAGTLGGGPGSRGWAPDTDRMTFVPDVIGTITTRGGFENRNAGDQLVPISFGWSNAAAQGDEVEFDLCSPLRSAGERVGGGKAVAYGIAENQRAELRLTSYSRQLTTGGGKPGQGYAAVLTPELAVRRLTPRECERLMGWPDDHTRYAADGTEIADSHRYRMCGNGVVAPVAAWIGRQLLAHIKAVAA